MISHSQISSTNKTIVWFRKDLRLRIIRLLNSPSPTKEKSYPYSFGTTKRVGIGVRARLRWWLHQALKSLEDSIEKHGGRFLFAKGKPAEILPEIAKENGASEVLYSRTYDPGGLATQEAVEEALDAVGIRSESFNASLLNEPWEVKNASGKPFQVFTPYWRNCRNGIYKKPADYPIRSLLFSNQSNSCSSLNDLDLLPSHPWHEKLFSHWDVSETAGQAQVGHTAREIVHSYAHLRNSPGSDGTSRLSPYLAWGMISPRQVCHSVLQNEPNDTNREKTSFSPKSDGVNSPTISLSFPTYSRQSLRPKYSAFPWLSDDRTLRKWQTGQTGYPWSTQACANSTKRVGCTTGSA